MTDEVGYMWADWTLRYCLPRALEVVGRVEEAGSLRACPSIKDESTVKAALDCLTGVMRNHGAEDSQHESPEGLVNSCAVLTACAVGYAADSLPDRAEAAASDAADRALDAGVVDATVTAVAAGLCERPPSAP
ncbi:hypothetical protein [Kribbella sp. NPDC003557]|uniref:hypothetical protein n=1 Tax=Kribbella sp. NPDC003557 TaxID=3154449 RepID=UPI0033AD3D6C